MNGVPTSDGALRVNGSVVSAKSCESSVSARGPFSVSLPPRWCSFGGEKNPRSDHQNRATTTTTTTTKIMPKPSDRANKTNEVERQPCQNRATTNRSCKNQVTVSKPSGTPTVPKPQVNANDRAKTVSILNSHQGAPRLSQAQNTDTTNHVDRRQPPASNRSLLLPLTCEFCTDDEPGYGSSERTVTRLEALSAPAAPSGASASSRSAGARRAEDAGPAAHRSAIRARGAAPGRGACASREQRHIRFRLVSMSHCVYSLSSESQLHKSHWHLGSSFLSNLSATVRWAP